MNKLQAEQCKDLIKSNGPLDVLLMKLNISGQIGHYDIILDRPVKITWYSAILSKVFQKPSGKVMPGAHLFIRYKDPENGNWVILCDRVFFSQAHEPERHILANIDYDDFCNEVEKAVTKLYQQYPA